MDIEQPFVTQEQKFKYWEESKAEIKHLRAKVNGLMEALREIECKDCNCDGWEFCRNNYHSIATKALDTYDKLSEVKHDTK